MNSKVGELLAVMNSLVNRRVISGSTARKTKEILKGVIENGTGKRAKLESYTAAGKTGTAQKIKPTGGYSHNKFIGSFIGFAPAGKPKIAVVVSLDEPRPVYYGGVVSAPVFKKVAEDTLRYLGVASDLKEDESLKVKINAKEN